MAKTSEGKKNLQLAETELVDEVTVEDNLSEDANTVTEIPTDTTGVEDTPEDKGQQEPDVGEGTEDIDNDDGNDDVDLSDEEDEEAKGEEETEPNGGTPQEEVVPVVPISNEDAIAYRDNIINQHEKDVPIYIDQLVDYINKVLKTMSESQDPFVLLNESLLQLALASINNYSADIKKTLIEEVATKYKEAGYNVAIMASTVQGTLPSYMIRLDRN